jgi:hypothetical protein
MTRTIIGRATLAACAAIIVAGGATSSATPGHLHATAISRHWLITARDGHKRPVTELCHSFSFARGGRECVAVISGR